MMSKYQPHAIVPVCKWQNTVSMRTGQTCWMPQLSLPSPCCISARTRACFINEYNSAPLTQQLLNTLPRFHKHFESLNSLIIPSKEGESQRKGGHRISTLRLDRNRARARLLFLARQCFQGKPNDAMTSMRVNSWLEEWSAPCYIIIFCPPFSVFS